MLFERHIRMTVATAAAAAAATATGTMTPTAREKASDTRASWD